MHGQTPQRRSRLVAPAHGFGEGACELPVAAHSDVRPDSTMPLALLNPGDRQSLRQIERRIRGEHRCVPVPALVVARVTRGGSAGEVNRSRRRATRIRGAATAWEHDAEANDRFACAQESVAERRAETAAKWTRALEEESRSGDVRRHQDQRVRAPIHLRSSLGNEPYELVRSEARISWIARCKSRASLRACARRGCAGPSVHSLHDPLDLGSTVPSKVCAGERRRSKR